MLVVLPGNALAAGYSTFGSRYRGQGSTGFYNYGDEVTIRVPTVSSHTVADDEFELSRAENQVGFGFDVQLIQVGLYRSGANHHLDNCATSVNQYTYYTEVNSSGSDNGFVCHLYGAAPQGEIDLYEASNLQSDGSGEWSWGIGGPGGGLPIAAGELYAGFSTAIPAFGEELSSPTGVSCQTSDVAAFYGETSDGHSGWNVYHQANGGDLQPVTDQSNTDWFNPNDRWNTPSLTPWPDWMHHSPC